MPTKLQWTKISDKLLVSTCGKYRVFRVAQGWEAKKEDMVIGCFLPDIVYAQDLCHRWHANCHPAMPEPTDEQLQHHNWEQPKHHNWVQLNDNTWTVPIANYPYVVSTVSASRQRWVPHYKTVEISHTGNPWPTAVGAKMVCSKHAQDNGILLWDYEAHATRPVSGDFFLQKTGTGQYWEAWYQNMKLSGPEHNIFSGSEQWAKDRCYDKLKQILETVALDSPPSQPVAKASEVTVPPIHWAFTLDGYTSLDDDYALKGSNDKYRLEHHDRKGVKQLLPVDTTVSWPVGARLAEVHASWRQERKVSDWNDRCAKALAELSNLDLKEDTKPEAPGVEWEYSTVLADTTDVEHHVEGKVWLEQLNMLGQEGWEVVDRHRMTFRPSYQFLLKRQKSKWPTKT
jgi:hypothetical protein